MRSAEAWRLGLALALCLSSAACAPIAAQRSAAGPNAAAPSPSGEDAAASAATASQTEARAPALPVDPAVQQAFDDARRALAAGRAAEAERGFTALTQSNPDLGGPHANLGLVYRNAGRLPEAVAELERAVSASPQQPVYLNQLGIAYRQQGEFGKAREAYEKAIALAPGYAAPRLNLGILLDLYLGESKPALDLYESYLGLSPGGDATVAKWIIDLKNRKPQALAANREEKP
jgi:Flp pilus assembly protein TadD